jgi:hypothetical protein
MPDSEQKKCNVCRVRFLCQTSEESICDGFGIEVIERAHGLCSDCEYVVDDVPQAMRNLVARDAREKIRAMVAALNDEGKK